MSRIDRYLTGQLLRPVIGIFLMVLVIMLIFYISRYLAEAASEQLSLQVVGRMAAFKLGLFLDVLIPAAMFLGIVAALGRLQSSYEVTALAATGAGRRPILHTVGRIAVLTMGLVFVLGVVFRPWGYDQLYTLEEELVTRIDLGRVEPGRFEIGDQQWLIFAERQRDGGLEGVLVHQRLPAYQNLLRARRLEQETRTDGSIDLIFSGNVSSYRLERGGDEDVVSRVERLVIHLVPPEAVARERRRRAMGMEELLDAGGFLEIGEIQWRLMGPVSVLILALSALLISRINPRQGQTARVLLGSLVVAIYFSLLGMLANWVDAGTIPPWPGLFWLPIVLLPLLCVRFWFKWRGAGPPL